ncbi:DUF3761 domain-containing protein [Jongsikchunia kroppenstedtii]|nr:DUF3761 domain-containing protein [Jongsikchunia kroppenstedtii]
MVSFIAALTLGGALLVAPAVANADSGISDCPAGDYSNSDGNCVPDPQAGGGSPPAGATAQCRDGDWSFSQHHKGTCSGHGGVADWLN